ncbi:hypothetical protein HON22_05515, partial [Candidatus Peregrinibacteria bacterium]|nr:hypothetical protein [Candidatus Peregrinibacteria bacterium]
MKNTTKKITAFTLALLITLSSGAFVFAALPENGSWGETITVKDGNVGIGTTSPGAKLEVIGNIFSKDANGGSVHISPIDGGLEIASGNDAFSYIDFKGNENLEEDYEGRIGFGSGLFQIMGGNVGIG